MPVHTRQTAPPPTAAPLSLQPLRSSRVRQHAREYVEAEPGRGGAPASIIEDERLRGLEADPGGGMDQVVVGPDCRPRGTPRLRDGFRFSLLRRHTATLTLSAYVIAELQARRLLFDILNDEPVRSLADRHPKLLEDLACDQLVLEAVTDGGR